MLRQVAPKNARSKRAMDEREAKVNENPKKTLFLHGTSRGQVVQIAMSDLNQLKKPLSIRFTKKNDIHPFADDSQLEFFSQKNDTSHIVFGHHAKKRPNCLTFVRCFNHKVLDMLELYIDADSFRSINQFKGRKCSAGLKPMLAFSGPSFENTVSTSYTLAKNMFIDMFRGQETESIDVEGLQYLIHISSGEEVQGLPAPKIHFRVYVIRTLRSGQKLPRVEVEEMGPRIDFTVGRVREANEDVMKEALKKPKHLEPKEKKNIGTSIIGDKVGRIHIGRQDLSSLQTRKMKGLKRDHSNAELDEEMLPDSTEAFQSSKKGRI